MATGNTFGYSVLVLDRGQVHARILPHRRVGAGAGLDADDPVLGQHALQGTLNVLGVLGRHHVVRDDQDAAAQLEQPRGKGLDQRGLSGADRTADADAGRLLQSHHLQFMNMRTCDRT